MKSTIWISCDLGVNGDYEGMYAWLDDHGAKECGSSVAFVKPYDYDGEDLMQALECDIRDTVKIDKRTRIYVIRRVDGKEKGGVSLWPSEGGSLGWLWPARRDL